MNDFELPPEEVRVPTPPPEETPVPVPAPEEVRAPAPRRPLDLGRLALPILTLAAAGFSVVTCLQTIALRPFGRFDYLSRNALGLHPRTVLLVTQGLGLLLPVIVVAILALRRRDAVDRVVRTAAALAGPLIPICLLPALFNPQFSHTNQLNYVLLLGLFALVFEPLMAGCLRMAGDWKAMYSARPLRWLTVALSRVPGYAPVAVVLIAAVAYALYVGHFTIMNHHRIGTTAFDLGIYDNLMYNALHGHPFKSPVLFGPVGGNYIAGHAEFAMLLFVPFYAIRPGAETMLIIQALVLGFAAVPLYLFASTVVSRWTAAAVAVTYLLFAPLHGPNFYDFHWLPLAIFFHFWLYYAIATRRTWLIALMVLVLFAMREDIAIGLVLLGLFLLVTGLRPGLGTILAITAGVWFGVVRFIIMPKAGSWYFQNFYSDLFADGQSSFASVIKTIITNPVYFLTTTFKENKLLYALHMLAPLAFLPCRRPAFLLLLLPGFVFTMMTTGYAPTLSISFQYTTHWVPYLFLGVVLGLVVIQRRWGDASRQQAALLTLLLVNLAHSFNFGAILQRDNFIGGFSKIEFSMSAAEKLQYAALKELTAMIPPTASVAATEREVPHVSARAVQYTMRAPLVPVDYILVSRSHFDNREIGGVALRGSDYGLLAQRRDEFYLFKRGHNSPETATAKAQLGL